MADVAAAAAAAAVAAVAVVAVAAADNDVDVHSVGLTNADRTHRQAPLVSATATTRSDNMCINPRVNSGMYLDFIPH